MCKERSGVDTGSSAKFLSAGILGIIFHYSIPARRLGRGNPEIYTHSAQGACSPRGNGRTHAKKQNLLRYVYDTIFLQFVFRQ